MKNNIDKIDWNILQNNENLQIIEIIKDYPDKINYTRLSNNKSIFQIFNNNDMIDNVISIILSDN